MPLNIMDKSGTICVFGDRTITRYSEVLAAKELLLKIADLITHKTSHMVTAEALIDAYITIILDNFGPEGLNHLIPLIREKLERAAI